MKNWVYSHSNLTIVTPSRWITEQAKQSMLTASPIHHIPYGIDTEAYQPLTLNRVGSDSAYRCTKSFDVWSSTSYRSP
jgi:hypothetical protein